MADSKKYDGSTWEHSLRKMTTATADIEPTIYTDGTAITSYTIKGNTVQNGTPTPSDPVPVVGVGELETTGEHSGEYKIPISSGGVTTNIYLTEQLMKINTYSDSVVSSGTVTYNIKKLVLTGDENFDYYSVAQGSLFRMTLNNSPVKSQLSEMARCSHYNVVSGNNRTNMTLSGILTIGSNVTILDFINNDYNNATAFKSHLADQYSAGTPVTVYYVLGTPTTETITASSIPTTEGANSITVDTTVQPSEFTAMWTGWHNASVKEYDGTDWQ